MKVLKLEDINIRSVYSLKNFLESKEIIVILQNKNIFYKNNYKSDEELEIEVIIINYITNYPNFIYIDS